MKSTSLFTRTAILSLFVAILVVPGASPALASSPSDEPPLCSAQTLTDYHEILWLARVIYSETKDPSEMRLIAWVVRNRVETNYHGTTYEEVATSKNQFSGLNPGDAQYATNISLGYDNSENRAWNTALHIATQVYTAPESARPFAKSVRHFYSPNVLSVEPSWTKDGTLAMVSNDEFAFYSNVR